jgi:RNA ligase (TIGR02306 family)
VRLKKRETLAEKYECWDITTRAHHNFVANGVVVHNSNARYVYAQDKNGEWKLFCGSRTKWMAEDDKNIWWMASRQNPNIDAWCKANLGKILYGEVFGQVQNLKYGAKTNDIFFRPFAILEKQQWIDYDQCIKLTQGMLDWVPLVYRGPFDEKKLLELAELDSLIPGANHMREGVVIVPVQERVDPELGRVCLKMVSNRYLGS